MTSSDSPLKCPSFSPVAGSASRSPDVEVSVWRRTKTYQARREARVITQAEKGEDR